MATSSATPGGSSWLPSRHTVIFVAQSLGKAAVVHSVLLTLMWVVSAGLAWLLGAPRFESFVRGLLFIAYQLLMISHALVAVLTSKVQQHQQQGAPQPAGEDRWEKWFNAAMLASLAGPLLLLYMPSAGEMADLATCAAAQWACKGLCFVGFPREVFSVPTETKPASASR